MDAWYVAAGAVAPLAAWPIVRLHRRRRDRMYAELAARHERVADEHPVAIACLQAEAAPCAREFAGERIARIEEFVSPECLARMRDEALAVIPRMERSYIPLHKQGRTLSYEGVQRWAPQCLSFYRNSAVRDWIVAVTGIDVYETPVQDQSSLSILCYQEAGDQIQWHYDHNFYRGRHFTVLLSLVNRGAAGGCSRSVLECRTAAGRERTVDTCENSLVVFEGARVRHRATAAAAGDLRVILSMTYCADPRISRTKELARRVKDTAFYGLRALWD